MGWDRGDTAAAIHDARRFGDVPGTVGDGRGRSMIVPGTVGDGRGPGVMSYQIEALNERWRLGTAGCISIEGAGHGHSLWRLEFESDTVKPRAMDRRIIYAPTLGELLDEADRVLRACGL